MSRRSSAALGLLMLLAPSHSPAAPASSSPAPTLDVSACDREPTAIARSACQLGTVFAAQASSALVVAAPAAGDQVALPAPAVEHLTALVAAKLGPAARASAQPLSLADAQRAASAARGLIFLTITLRRDRLEVGADSYLGAGHFWQRVRSPGLHLQNHASSTSPLDPDLRALFPAIRLLVTRVEKATNAERDVLALGCGDVRGDGSSELVTVGRRKVQVGQLDHGRFNARASLNWADHSAVAPNPLREPIASCALPEPGRLWVGSSDRADALDLSGALQVEHTWHGVMPWPGGGCTQRAGLGYAGQARPCPGSPATPVVDFGTPLDAFTTRSLANREGQTHTVRLGRAVGSDAARALDSLHAEVTVPNVGAQLAIGDLDEDGLPEIVSSLPTLERKADQLVVRTLTDNGQLRELWRLPVPSGIDAIAICPGDGRAMAPIALATGDGIWVIR